MRENRLNLASQVSQTNGAHIFYNSSKVEAYIDNTVSFIVHGIHQGDCVLLVENSRIYPKILKELQGCLVEEEMAKLHYINNFDFYWRNGNFHPPTILAYFSEVTDSLGEEEQSFRTWGHIEWADQQDIEREIEAYENDLNRLVPEKKAVSVCAYDAARVSEDLKDRLIRCHGYLMTDDSITCLATN